jgi:hypothetical protein
MGTLVVKMFGGVTASVKLAVSVIGPFIVTEMEGQLPAWVPVKLLHW